MISFLPAMDLSFLLLLLATFILVFFAFRLSRILRSSCTHRTKIKLPPGPWKLPIIGSLHHLAGGSLPHHVLRDLSRRYGPIMHLQLGEIAAVIVSSPKMAYEVMKTHDTNFANRPEFLAPKILLYDFQDISFAPYGAYWRQMRKICTLELLSAKCIRSFSSIREDECLKLIVSIKSSPVGSPINITKKFFELTNDITCRAVFGNKCIHKDALIKLISESASVTGGFDVSDLFPSLKFLHVGTKPRLVSIHQKTDRILESIIAEHEEDRKNQQSRSDSREEHLLDVLLRHQKSTELECPITRTNIKAILLDVLGGGTDTAASLLESAMSELMRNRRVMEKIQGELRQKLKGKKIIQGTDIAGLDYLKLLVKETLRLHPPLPLLLPRENLEQCEIDGYLIPAKTKVIVNAWAIGRDPDYWKDDDPEQFIPERFRESSVNFLGSDFQYIPFGAGRRICPGINFGVANVELALAQLLYHFNWELPMGMKPEDLDMTDIFGAAVRKRTELLLVATPYLSIACDD